MPSAITLRTSGHSATGAARWCARSSIQIMSPCAPSASHWRSRSPARGAASPRATPTATKPNSAAFCPSSARKALSSRTPPRYHSRRATGEISIVAQQFVLEAQGLVKKFGGKRVVDGVDIAVPTGMIYGVLGPQWRRQDDDAADAARHHRTRRRRAQLARLRSTRARRAIEWAICPRSVGSTRR